MKQLIILILISASSSYSQWINKNLAGPLDVIPQLECTIGRHPTNNNLLMVAFNDFTNPGESQPGYSYSSDGGQTFTPLQAIPNTASEYGFDPCIQFSNNGTIYYSYISSTTTNLLGRVQVSRTSNQGASWFTAIVSNGEHEDKPWLAIDNTSGNYSGRVYISWMNATGGEPKILFSYSTNGGATFQPECIISLISGQVDSAAFSFPTEVIPQTNPANMILQSPIPFVAPNGNVYIVWMQNNGTSAYNACEQKFIKSTDGGVSFGPVRSLANFTHEIAGDWCHLRFRHWPSFAIDGLTGYLYVVYRDRESQFSSTPRIKFVRSTNNGISWSTPIIIGNLGELGETFPWVATNSLGKVAVSFLHKKNTGLIDCYVIESENSGVSFGNSVLVSTEASTSCGFYVASFDYQGIVIDNLGNDYVVWTDFSSENGNGDPFFSKVNTTPSTPGGFYISGNVGQNPTLHWNLFGTDIANYKIYYKVNNGNENLLVTVSGSTNSFTDPGVVITGNKRDDEFCYRISAVDYASQESPKTNWACVFSNIINKDPITNENYKEEISFKLEEAYPNPFNPSTSINYSIPEKSFITLQVYDLLGIKKAELVSEQKEPGSYVVEFNASKYPSGVYIYIYILQSGEYVSSKKMLLIK